MKRSEINDILRAGDAFIRSFNFLLPPFAAWTPDDMRARRPNIGEIIGSDLGWDITDFGSGAFEERGLFLFTLRNGREEDLRRGAGMCYAEKIMVVRQDQITPMHRHIVKGEDIINRGGATLAVKLYASDEEGGIDRSHDVRVATDGLVQELDPGSILRIAPGESVTLLPGVWHAFWAEGGDALVGEVSTVNNDRTDNVFAEPVGRFPEIEEDEAPWRLLVSDYGKWFA
ncbi:MAG: D-lyxose/D-mannose family sugar isomerase [Amaricoccus sp.]|uniref:D-lyxose/D-mannose family sugar isomerase n=1 Tax=Amaricoccus sp. TaxID=1872485 RepID=UPI0039E2B6AB